MLGPRSAAAAQFTALGAELTAIFFDDGVSTAGAAFFAAHHRQWCCRVVGVGC
jgi:hypothetical protein